MRVSEVFVKVRRASTSTQQKGGLRWKHPLRQEGKHGVVGVGAGRGLQREWQRWRISCLLRAWHGWEESDVYEVPLGPLWC